MLTHPHCLVVRSVMGQSLSRFVEAGALHPPFCLPKTCFLFVCSVMRVNLLLSLLKVKAVQVFSVHPSYPSTLDIPHDCSDTVSFTPPPSQSTSILPLSCLSGLTHICYGLVFREESRHSELNCTARSIIFLCRWFRFAQLAKGKKFRP